MGDCKEAFYHRVGIFVALASCITLLILFTSVCLITWKANDLRYETVVRSENFKWEAHLAFQKRADSLWSKMIEMQTGVPSEARVIRHTNKINHNDPISFMFKKCSQCTKLACPTGPSGLPGPSGEDGIPEFVRPDQLALEERKENGVFQDCKDPRVGLDLLEILAYTGHQASMVEQDPLAGKAFVEQKVPKETLSSLGSDRRVRKAHVVFQGRPVHQGLAEELPTRPEVPDRKDPRGHLDRRDRKA